MNFSGTKGPRMGTTASAIQGEAAPIAQRVRVSYWDAEGNETVRFYSVELPRHEWPEVIISPKTGLPAGLDKDNPPVSEETNAQKTHFEYVLERRTPEEGEALLNRALERLRAKRGVF